jgi:hypothetical protein
VWRSSMKDPRQWEAQVARDVLVRMVLAKGSPALAWPPRGNVHCGEKEMASPETLHVIDCRATRVGSALGKSRKQPKGICNAASSGCWVHAAERQGRCIRFLVCS